MESKKGPTPTRPCLQIAQTSSKQDLTFSIHNGTNQFLAHIDPIKTENPIVIRSWSLNTWGKLDTKQFFAISREKIFGDEDGEEIMDEVSRMSFAGAHVFGGEEMAGFGGT